MAIALVDVTEDVNSGPHPLLHSVQKVDTTRVQALNRASTNIWTKKQTNGALR